MKPLSECVKGEWVVWVMGGVQESNTSPQGGKGDVALPQAFSFCTPPSFQGTSHIFLISAIIITHCHTS